MVLWLLVYKGPGKLILCVWPGILSRMIMLASLEARFGLVLIIT